VRGGSSIEGESFKAITMILATNNNFSARLTGYRAILQAEFAAPVLRGRPVIVAVDEACCRVHIVPPTFQGWAVARLISPSVAIVVREADADERNTLLNQWHDVSLQVCHVSSLGVLAVRLSDDAASSVVRVHLCGEAVQSGDTLQGRFDGRQYWFDRISARNSVGGLVRFASAADVLPDLCTATFATSFPLDDAPMHG
jgi:hypothetical protein